MYRSRGQLACILPSGEHGIIRVPAVRVGSEARGSVVPSSAQSAEVQRRPVANALALSSGFRRANCFFEAPSIRAPASFLDAEWTSGCGGRVSEKAQRVARVRWFCAVSDSAAGSAR